MSFISVKFLIFFPAVVTLYYLTPCAFRWVLLLAASCYFYMCWRPWYIFIILFSSSVDYVAGLMMERTKDRSKRKFFLLTSLSANIGILFVFKYFNFFTDAAAHLAHALGMDYMAPVLYLVLPLGLSFHTFQSMAYAIDVYRGTIKAERHYGIFALFVMFFPQLTAGPIERAKHLLPQFYEKHDFNYDRMADGLRLMLWGFFKKVVIADRLAIYVNQVYNHPDDYSGLTFVVATWFFAYQIFCDFSGYSDIAIGAAKVLGFDLMDNFNRPFAASSIVDFWRRWHISLSTWFRDYLYFPLGGNRVSAVRHYYNLLVVFLISGLWHGASMHFLYWGLFHALLMVAYLATRLWREHLAGILGLQKTSWIGYGFSVAITYVVTIASWFLFRVNSTQDISAILGKIFHHAWQWKDALAPVPAAELWTSLALIAGLEIIHSMQSRFRLRDAVADQPVALRWSVYLTAIFIIFVLGKFNDQPFIYFQF